jgi:ParB-like chromosome segregation protein Spo0J
MKVADLGVAEIMSAKDIKPYEKNPRKIPDRAIEIVAESLKRFGWQQPLIVDPAKVLVCGHTRLLAAQRLGEDKVPVIVADKLTEDEIRAFRIADNRTHDFTSWDYPELISELDALPDDFADVLALEDWQSIIDKFDEEFDIDVPDDVRADAEGGFSVTLVFVDKESAEAAQQYLVDLDGVLDVRYKV